MIFFCCENYSMTGDMYNNFGGIMEVLKRTVARMKHSIGESCNNSKYPLSLCANKKCVRF